MEGAGLPDRGVLSCLNQRSPGAAVGGARCTEDDVGRMTTSVANQLQSAPLAEGESKTVVTKTPWWDRPALFRYGFVALILIVWEIVGPFIIRSFLHIRRRSQLRFIQPLCLANCRTTSRKAWRSWPTA